MMDTPAPQPAYSTRSIVRASVGALAVALLVLVLAVLPAEYGVDVTGFGRAVGLTNLAQPDATATPAIARPWQYASTEEEFVVRPREGLEFKLLVQRGDAMVYFWSASKPIFYEFHGEPTTPSGEAFLPYKTYWKQTDWLSGGSLVPEFTGTHGWFFRNDGAEPITIKLTASGYYEQVGIKK